MKWIFGKATAKLITVIETVIDMTRNWLNQTFIRTNRLTRQTVGIFNVMLLNKTFETNKQHSKCSIWNSNDWMS